jgi:ferredoxin
MNDNFYSPVSPKKFLFKYGEENEHLHILYTDLGKKTIYDSVCQCNKCNYCSRVCPTHLSAALESRSARGRNQAVRLIMEGKIAAPANKKELKKVLNSCVLCGACTRECFAKIPTHEHVLEAERAFAKRKWPPLARFILKIKKYRSRLLRRSLQNKIKTEEKDAVFLYLPSFEAAFEDAKTGLKCMEILRAEGPVNALFESCGLHDYIYGSLEEARKKAARLMQKRGRAKMVTDSLEIYAFVQKYPQLFEGSERENEAEVFRQNFFYIADFIKATEAEGKVLLSRTNLFNCEESLFASSVKALSALPGYQNAWAGDAYPSPTLGGVKKNKAFLINKIKHAARAQADTLAVCSPAQKAALYFWAKKYYPKLKVVHITDIARLRPEKK